MNSINRLHLYLLIGLWLLVHGFLLYHLGIRANLYDSQVYIRGANFFLEHGTFEVSHHFFYAVPILLIAFFKLLSVDGVTGFIFFQVFTSGVAALFLYRAASALFKDQNAGLISAVIFLCWWDIIQWNTTVMTESIACSLICLVILRLANFRSTFKDYAILILVLLLGTLTRPTGVLIIFSAVIFVVTRHWNSFNS